MLNLTARDGLIGPGASHLQRDHDGNLWFLSGGQVHQFDGDTISVWSERMGWPTEASCTGMRRDAFGVLWLVSNRHKLYRFDGRALSLVFSAPNGSLTDLHLDFDRTVWLGVGGQGLFHYNAGTITQYGARHGLPVDAALAYQVVRTQDGELWVGLGRGPQKGGGLRRFQEGQFTEPTEVAQFRQHSVNAMGPLVHGGFWAATDAGLIQYKNGTGHLFTAADGLAPGRVLSGFVSSDGRLWCGTEQGVSQFDGAAWSTLDVSDGLAGARVNSISEDDERDIWFATEAGLSRYRRETNPPSVEVRSLQADGRLYSDLGALPEFAAGTRLNFAFEANADRVQVRKWRYRCRIDAGIRTPSDLVLDEHLEGLGHWQRPIRAAMFEWIPAKAGTYTFAVQSIDRDLNYSEPGLVVITITAPWYTGAGFMTLLGIGVVMIGVASVFARPWWRRLIGRRFIATPGMVQSVSNSQPNPGRSEGRI